LQRIFSQNKAEDTGNPLWIAKDDNAVMRKTDAKRRVKILFVHVLTINIQQNTLK
jgi:hypothetical protein